MIIECLIWTYKTFNSIDNHVASLKTSTSPLYLASKDDRAMVGCFFDDHEISLLPKVKKNPIVNCTCSKSPL